ncbi:MAG: phytoene desaturase family protein, partial [Candidatus Acidiferrales bacterium]
NKPVERLTIENGRCVGVECADGTSYRADKAVVSTAHIKQLVKMAPSDHWPADFLDGVRTFGTGGSSFNSHFATTEPLKFPVKDGFLTPVHISNIPSCKRALRFENELMNGDFTLDEPVLHIVQTSVADPTRAPAGMHTIRVLCEEAVYNLKDGGPGRWAEIRSMVEEAHLKAVQRLATNLTDDKILGRMSTSPVDIEQMNPSMWHGCCHSGTDGPAQGGALRPVPGWAQYRMPIAGLYQTGATTHPGGGVSGGSGRNAAVVMLKDFGTSIESVLSKNKS